MVISFVLMLIVNSILLFLINKLFPQAVVLGTHHITWPWAILHSMITLALILTAAIPAFHEVESRRGKELSPADWMLGYLVINFASLWTISRFSENIGLGMSSWFVVLLVAAVFDWAQGMVMMGLQKLSEQVKK